jgi:hypothetical protein
LWALYYATDWFANPGQAIWIPAFGLVLMAWGLLTAAAIDFIRSVTRRPKAR